MIVYHILGNKVGIFASVVTPACCAFCSYPARSVNKEEMENYEG